jgi:mono/diheme cytochrome c family protein
LAVWSTILTLGLLTALSAAGAPAPADGGAPPTYAGIAAILQKRCVVCHSGDAAPLGLRLDSHAGVLRGSQRGPVVKPGAPAGSELVRRIRGLSVPRMPLTGPPYLSEDEIALIERWIAGGLPEGKAARVPDAQAPSRPAGPARGEPVTYAHVAPLFVRRCVKCHTDSGVMGRPPEGYRLTTYETTLRSERARVVPGHPGASELVRRIRGQALPRMPFDGPPYLVDDEIALIETWVKQGARNAAGEVAPVPVGAPVRLHGRLVAQWTLDDTPLGVDRGTRVDRRVGVGDYVEVRGVIERDGTVRATRIRSR